MQMPAPDPFVSLIAASIVAAVFGLKLPPGPPLVRACTGTPWVPPGSRRRNKRREWKRRRRCSRNRT